MSLAERLTVVERPSRCKVGVVLACLDTADQAALTDALADRRRPAREITAALRAEGHDIGRTVVQEHRAGTCRCGIG